MKDASSKLGKAPGLGVGQPLNGPGLADDSWVCFIDSAYIGEVLVQLGTCRSGHDGACYVRSSTGECSDLARIVPAIEASNAARPVYSDPWAAEAGYVDQVSGLEIFKAEKA